MHLVDTPVEKDCQRCIQSAEHVTVRLGSLVTIVIGVFAPSTVQRADHIFQSDTPAMERIPRLKFEIGERSTRVSKGLHDIG